MNSECNLRIILGFAKELHPEIREHQVYICIWSSRVFSGDQTVSVSLGSCRHKSDGWIALARKSQRALLQVGSCEITVLQSREHLVHFVQMNRCDLNAFLSIYCRPGDCPGTTAKNSTTTSSTRATPQMVLLGIPGTWAATVYRWYGNAMN